MSETLQSALLNNVCPLAVCGRSAWMILQHITTSGLNSWNNTLFIHEKGLNDATRINLMYLPQGCNISLLKCYCVPWVVQTDPDIYSTSAILSIKFWVSRMSHNINTYLNILYILLRERTSTLKIGFAFLSIKRNISQDAHHSVGPGFAWVQWPKHPSQRPNQRPSPWPSPWPSQRPRLNGKYWEPPQDVSFVL